MRTWVFSSWIEFIKEQFQKCARRRNTYFMVALSLSPVTFWQSLQGEKSTVSSFCTHPVFDFYKMINFKCFLNSLYIFILHVSRCWRKEAIGSIWVRCSTTSQIYQVAFLFLFLYKCALALDLTSYEFLAVSFVNKQNFILVMSVWLPMPKSQSWVRSQHPLTLWNRRGGWWSSVEYSTVHRTKNLKIPSV